MVCFLSSLFALGGETIWEGKADSSFNMHILTLIDLLIFWSSEGFGDIAHLLWLCSRI